MDSRDDAATGGTRTSIVRTAALILRDGGPDALTTRAVADQAGVHPPTIYRLFGDKAGLLDAVAEHVFTDYVARSARLDDGGDPVVGLRAGWDTHIDFGLANASLFILLADPAGATPSPAASAGVEVLQARVHRVAQAGRLRMPEDRAVQLIHAAGTGVVLTLLSTPPATRNRGLADLMFDTLTRSLLTDVSALDQHDAAAAAVTFRTLIPQLPRLTEAERTLMSEWLQRAAKP